MLSHISWRNNVQDRLDLLQLATMTKIESLLEFTKFCNKFQQTQRQIRVVGEARKENDAEHSFQVALTCWYLISEYKLDLDITKVLKYALAHDLPEAITGDYYFELDSQKQKEKEDAEKVAIDKLGNMFPNFAELANLLEDYNNKIDKEARFVNATEKLIPVINIFLDKGKTWKEENMTWDILIPNKDKKISISDLPSELWEEFKPIIEESGLLPKTKS